MATITNYYVHQVVVHESEASESKDDRVFTRITPSLGAVVDEIVRVNGLKDRSQWLRHVINRACMEYEAAKGHNQGDMR